jgi:hypothetical protein
MSHELIYTSVAQGLRPGTRGFCAVAQTNGIPAGLLERLESISGYRHLFEPHTAQAHLNPVAWSYLRITAANVRFQVLSRVADAGLDYSQRTNKLAHHLACSAPECPAAGPAAALRQPGLMLTSWNEQPHMLTAGRVPRGGDRPAQPCQQWQRVLGDAGWAGLLAETIQNKTDAYVIYQPGLEVLDLFLEALALLPAEQRWEATFQTYFTRLPPGIDCRWRGVIAGSEEESLARRSSNALLIDTTRPAGVPKETPGVLAARAGQPLPQKAAAAVAIPNLPGMKPTAAMPARRSTPLQPLPALPGADADYDLYSSELPPPALPAWDPSKAQQIERSNTRVYLLSAAAVLGLSALMLGGMFGLGLFDPPAEVVTPLPVVERTTPVTPPPEPVKPPPSEATAQEQLQQRQLAWEDRLRPHVENLRTLANQFVAARDTYVQTLTAAKTAEALSPEALTSLKTSHQEVLKKVAAFDTTLSALKRSELTASRKTEFPNSALHAEVAQLETAFTAARAAVPDGEHELRELQKKQNQAKNQLEQQQRQLANQEAIKALNQQRYFSLSTIKKNDGSDDPNGVQTVKFPVSNPQQVQLQLLNLPENIFKLIPDKAAASTWSLLKMRETPAGEDTTLGRFQITKQGLEYKPLHKVKAWLNKLDAGVLRVSFDAKAAGNHADLWFGKPSLGTISHPDKQFQEVVKLPLQELNRRFSLSWSYPASAEETLHVVAKITPKTEQESKWNVSKEAAAAWLAEAGQHQMRFTWSVKREASSDSTTTVLQINPVFYLLQGEHVVEEANLLTWLSDTFSKLKSHEASEISRKADLEKEKKEKKDDLKKKHDAESARELAELQARWPLQWIKEYAAAFEKNALPPGQKLDDFMHTKFNHLLENYDLQIQVFRRIPLNDKYLDIELPYHN